MVVMERRGSTSAASVLLLFGFVCASAQVVDLNPQEQIPGGVGDLISGDEDKPIVQRWTFWFGMALAAALIVVLTFFTWRGFRNHKRWKAQQMEEEEKERTAAAAEGATLNPVIAALDDHARMVEIEELARRTGRRKQDLVHAPLGGHFRSSSIIEPV